MGAWPQELYHDATHAWGEEAQITLAQEELAELNVELARHFRGHNDYEDVIDEIADVLVAVNQLALIFGLDETEERIEFKLRRLRERVDRDLDTASEQEPVPDGGAVAESPAGFEDLEYVDVNPPIVAFEALGTFDGRCAVTYHGAAGRCSGDPHYKTTIGWAMDTEDLVALCPDHAGRDTDEDAEDAAT